MFAFGFFVGAKRNIFRVFSVLMKSIIRIILLIAIFLLADYGIDRFLKTGLDSGMGLNEHAKVLIVGHSHLMMGLDKALMEKELHCKVAKHTRSGVGVEERYLMTKMFLDSPYSDSLQVVIIGVDPFLFNGMEISQNCYTLFYPWMDEKNVKDYIQTFTDPLTYYTHKCFRTSRYSDDLIKQSVRGWMNDDRNYKTVVFTDSMFYANRSKWDKPIRLNPALMSKLEETIKLCTNRAIKVMLLQTPIHHLLIELHHEKYDEICNYYERLAKNDTLIAFVNYGQDYQNDDIFFDPIHLNVNGQKNITPIVDSIVVKNWKDK